jgi:hypothetical protein
MLLRTMLRKALRVAHHAGSIQSAQAAYPSGTLRERFCSRDFQSPNIFALAIDGCWAIAIA